jgi:xanthine dehydrogenase YagS FAD-binding subunit
MTFHYHRPGSAHDALERLGEAGALPMGGGTDLLVAIEERLARPEVLVDLRAVGAWRGVRSEPDGSLRIGAGTRVQELAAHPLVRERWPALAEACESVGTAALRHMGTIGGNLCQRPRCWYLRRGVPCLKNGGDGCPAREGENQYHAILDGGPCWIVHPSDPAVALAALDAAVEVASATGTRTIAISEFYLLPAERLDHETVLGAGEIVSAVLLPAASGGGVQRYRKLTQRATWDFALVSLAAAQREDGEIRLVLGGVAPRPWRVGSSIEEDVSVGGLDDDAIDALAERALYDAEPLAHNGYKVQLAASLLRDAMRLLGGDGR